MGDFDNTIEFSDDDDHSDAEEDQGGKTCKCKLCESAFSPGDKGCSALKELCRKCHAKESAELLNALDVGEEVKKGKQINSLNNNRNNSFVYQMTPLLLIKRTLPRLMK